MEQNYKKIYKPTKAVKKALSEEASQLNIENYDSIELLMSSAVKPFLNETITLYGYGFQDGFGDSKFKDIPHFGIGLVGKSKLFIAYLIFENKIPDEHIVSEIVQNVVVKFKKYRRPLSKRKRNTVRRMVEVCMPETFPEDKLDQLNISEIF